MPFDVYVFPCLGLTMYRSARESEGDRHGVREGE
jgi:hypothetical protein